MNEYIGTRLFTALFLTVAVAATLTGCGKSEGNRQESSSDNSVTDAREDRAVLAGADRSNDRWKIVSYSCGFFW